MSRWDDRFEAHGIKSVLDNLQQITQKIIDEPNGDGQKLEEINRFAYILKYITNSILSCDPLLANFNTLDTIANYLNSTASELNAFINTNNSSYLVNANNQLDSNVIPYLPQFLIYNTTSDVEVLRESASSFRKSVGQYTRRMESEYTEMSALKDQLKADVTNLTGVIEQQKVRLDNALNQHQDQFSNAEDSRRTQFNAEEEKRQAKHIEGTEKRQEKFDFKIMDMENSFKELLQQQNNDGHEIIEDINFEAKDLLTKLEEYKSHAERLVNVIANTGMAGGYQKIANEEQKAATNWRIFSLVSLIGLVGFAVFSFHLTLSTQFSWTQFAGRVFVAGTFGALFAYAAKQASDHSKVERVNRKVELELASIDPFLVGLPKEKQIEIRGMLAQKIFGSKEIPSEVADNYSGTSVDIVKYLLDIVQTAVKNK